MTDDHLAALLESFQEQLKTHGANATEQIRTFKDAWKEQDSRATKGREILYGKVEDLGKIVTSFGHEVRDNSSKVESLARDVSEMKPAVEDWKTSKNMAVGATKAVKTIWISAITLGGTALAVLGWLFGNFWSIIAK